MTFLTLTPANDLTPVTMLIVAWEDIDTHAKEKLCAASIDRSMRYHRRSQSDNCQNHHIVREIQHCKGYQEQVNFVKCEFLALIPHFKPF